MSDGPVFELRVALTVDDFEQALALYRDALGLAIESEWSNENGRGAILPAGRATIELVDHGQAAMIDSIEVGRSVSGPVRIALQVTDSAGSALRLESAGPAAMGAPVDTPWRHRNVRLRTPEGVQLTLFSLLDG